jgi:hypothetical protein
MSDIVSSPLLGIEGTGYLYPHGDGLTSHLAHRWNRFRVLRGSRFGFSSMDVRRLARLLLEMSNFYCLPGRAGGSPLFTSVAR